jgi:hypothetical protein
MSSLEEHLRALVRHLAAVNDSPPRAWAELQAIKGRYYVIVRWRSLGRAPFPLTVTVTDLGRKPAPRLARSISDERDAEIWFQVGDELPPGGRVSVEIVDAASTRVSVENGVLTLPVYPRARRAVTP